MRKTIILIFILFFGSLFPAQEYYSGLRKKYWEYEENDLRAFKYLDIYISSAKKEKNYAELFQGYSDAIRYSKNKKLQYADSAIMAASLSKNIDLIGNAHIGKGAVYYFTYRKFQPALDEYLKAYEYTKNAKDPFLKYQNLYHIGIATFITSIGNSTILSPFKLNINTMVNSKAYNVMGDILGTNVLLYHSMPFDFTNA